MQFLLAFKIRKKIYSLVRIYSALLYLEMQEDLSIIAVIVYKVGNKGGVNGILVITPSFPIQHIDIIYLT